MFTPFIVRLEQNYEAYISRVLHKNIFRDRDYLRFSRYTAYLRLYELTKIVEIIENFCRRRSLKPERCSILDIGCGPGNVALPLASLGYNVQGIDIDTSVLQLANSRRKSFGLTNIQFILADACTYFENHCNEKFHAVICSNVLEHVKDPEKLLEDAHKVMCNNGIVIIIVPNGFGMFELLVAEPQKILRKIFHVGTSLGDEHIQKFTLRRIYGMLGQAHFNLMSAGSSSLFPLLLFLANSSLALIDIKIAGCVPKTLASSWIIVGGKA